MLIRMLQLHSVLAGSPRCDMQVLPVRHLVLCRSSDVFRELMFGASRFEAFNEVKHERGKACQDQRKPDLTSLSRCVGDSDDNGLLHS